jgi:hypothetical protein
LEKSTVVEKLYED